MTLTKQQKSNKNIFTLIYKAKQRTQYWRFFYVVDKNALQFVEQLTIKNEVYSERGGLYEN